MTKMKRFLAIALTLVMLFSLTATMVLADDISTDVENPDFNVGGDPTPNPSTPSTSSSIKITFLHGDEFTMEAKPGTTKLSDGSVQARTGKGLLNENLIPESTGVDEYYAVTDWAIKDGDDLKIIDFETYRFEKDTELYAIVKDSWPVYTDMKADRSDWFYQYVRDLSVAGVVDGFNAGDFRPQGELTWGQALKLVMLASGYEVQEPTTDHWASGYLTKAKADGLVAADREVDLDAAIARIDVAEIAAKALKLEEVDIESPFADTDAMAVLQLYVAEIVEGNVNAQGVRNFHPNDTITRAEISAIVWRIEHYAAEA